MDSMDLREFLRDLREIPMIHDLSEEVADRVCMIFVHVCKGGLMSKGEVLYEKGTTGENTGAILAKGAVEIDSGEGKLIRRRAPELFGEMRQFDSDNRRTATVTIAEESVVFEFSWHAFIAMALHVLTSNEQLELKNVLSNYAGSRLEELTENAEKEREEYLNAFNEIPLLQNLPEELRDKVRDILVGISDLFTLHDGEVRYVKGESEDNLGSVLVQGKVSVDMEGDASKQCTAPELFGEMIQFSNEEECAGNVTASGPCVLFRFSWNDFAAAASVRLSKEDREILRGALKESVDERIGELIGRAAAEGASETAQKT